MILVTGGIASGKRTLVRGLGYAPEDFSADPADGTPVVVDVQELARGGADEALADLLAERELLIYTEVGAGVVPLDPGERAWRERAGRLACELSARADCVVRMVCGIPQVLKGDLGSVRG